MVIWRSWSVLLAGTLCFGSFVWAAKYHFRDAGMMSRGMLVLSGGNLVGFAWFVFGLNVMPGGYRLAPFALCVLSMLLFWWCILHTRRQHFTLAFSKDTPSFLDTRGPYRVARHPFYLSYLIFWVAVALAIPSAVSWSVVAIMVGLYTLAATREEAKFLKSSLASDYQIYRRQTGIFFPLLVRRG